MLVIVTLCATFIAFPAAIQAARPMIVGDGLVLSCAQQEAVAVRCNYRLSGDGRPVAASASIGDVSLPAPTFAERSGTPTNIATLLLVDTSDPAREPAIRMARKHIAKLVNGAEPHLRFGLASFDSDLSVLAPIGSDKDSIVKAANSLTAKGPTTELYRNVVSALNLLSTATDEHKVLMVLSDGLAEDRAYFHADAVRVALEHHIAIYSIGYPRSVALSVGLQSLRRLADETAGQFVDTDARLNLPDEFFTSPFRAIENVGALSVDLRGAVSSLAGGSHEVRITLDTHTGPKTTNVPVTMPQRIAADPVVKVVEIEVPKVIEVEKIVRVPEVATPTVGANITQKAPSAQNGVPLWYWAIAIALLAAALLVLLLVLFMQRRSSAAQSIAGAASAPLQAPTADNVAYLTLDEDTDRIPQRISSATFRIGRLEDNDLMLQDPSVSRHHAEIRRRRDGSYHVLDLDSMNGVFVNGKKIRESELNPSDVLDVGDVRMRLSTEHSTDLPGEETMMLSTLVPDGPLPGAARAARH